MGFVIPSMENSFLNVSENRTEMPSRHLSFPKQWWRQMKEAKRSIERIKFLKDYLTIPEEERESGSNLLPSSAYTNSDTLPPSITLFLLPYAM